MRKLLAVLFLWGCGLSLIAQQAYFPAPGEWQQKSPQELGLNTDKIQQAVQFAIDHEYQGPKDLRLAIVEGFQREPYHQILGPTKKRGPGAGMIIKDGYLVASWGDTKRVDMTFSVTKSYLSTVAGLAWDAKFIPSLEQPLHEIIWDRKFEGDHNSQITWRHLLDQSSDWSGELWGLYDWADRPPMEGGIDQWRYRKLNPPGTVFKYNDVRVNLLAFSLLQVWRKPLPMVLKEKNHGPYWRFHHLAMVWI